MEFISPEGLRLDGRRPMEMRQIRAEIGVVSKADGSAMFEMGNTKVIAAVYGPREVQNRSQQLNANAFVRCEYTMANFSTGDRMRKPKGDRRSTEISLVIRQTMEECILTNLMPRSQIDIFVQVLQADGVCIVVLLFKAILIKGPSMLRGTRSACINAATLALADAGIPMRDLVTSCSAGYLNNTPLLDLNYIEDSAGGADVTLGIMPKLDKVTLLQMDAKLSLDTFENVMQLAIEGCKAVADYIREVI
ncbi:PREDICTED: exosome complex component RRP41-like isoform 1 [Fragaria vesca subsp. vesca]